MTPWIYISIMLLAIGSSAILLRRFQQQLPIERTDKLLLGIAAFSGAMMGAKLPFVLSGEESLFSGMSWLSNGKTIMFGLVGGYLAVEFMKWQRGIRVRTGDSYAIPVAIGIAMGRLACFSAGCCYGTETNLPWGVHFSSVDVDPQVYRHPIQLYEFLFHATAAAMLMWLHQLLYSPERNVRTWVDYVFHGNLIKAYFVAYFIYRFWTEFIRPEADVIGPFSIYQVFSTLLLPLFALLWVFDVWSRYQHAGQSANCDEQVARRPSG